jgi:hypothetical protein
MFLSNHFRFGLPACSLFFEPSVLLQSFLVESHRTKLSVLRAYLRHILSGSIQFTLLLFPCFYFLENLHMLHFPLALGLIPISRLILIWLDLHKSYLRLSFNPWIFLISSPIVFKQSCLGHRPMLISSLKALPLHRWLAVTLSYHIDL